ncbi:spore germination protein GerW family protein [Catenuloplanes indicus]|uniref:Spore protein YtfJ n=1 Tax=Catenuloplanes indicus TaxID=137267 RepID=A0AAE3VTV1_9ACTN|nr:spore germination protein GerW family protein [Catenuloplanes indicus]MDQ0363567.1 putative spore protein YtfJ [Catenuloplanes indicus]
MTVETVIRELHDSAGADRVFGAPVVRDGVTVLPVARISGATAHGTAAAAISAPGEPESPGSGAGSGLSAKPAGVYVIRDGAVCWRPAYDINRIILGGQIVAVTALLTIRTLIRARAARG